jgi:hypothetical protein
MWVIRPPTIRVPASDWLETPRGIVASRWSHAAATSGSSSFGAEPLLDGSAQEFAQLLVVDAEAEGDVLDEGVRLSLSGRPLE